MPGYANPQSFNRFTYVRNNPIRYTDPTGHMDWEGDDGGCSPCTELPQPQIPNPVPDPDGKDLKHGLCSHIDGDFKNQTLPTNLSGHNDSTCNQAEFLWGALTVVGPDVLWGLGLVLTLPEGPVATVAYIEATEWYPSTMTTIGIGLMVDSNCISDFHLVNSSWHPGD